MFLLVSFKKIYYTYLPTHTKLAWVLGGETRNILRLPDLGPSHNDFACQTCGCYRGMSQVSFLESVVSWSESQCRDNLADALPKLIVSFSFILLLFLFCLSWVISFQTTCFMHFLKWIDKNEWKTCILS